MAQFSSARTQIETAGGGYRVARRRHDPAGPRTWDSPCGAVAEQLARVAGTHAATPAVGIQFFREGSGGANVQVVVSISRNGRLSTAQRAYLTETFGRESVGWREVRGPDHAEVNLINNAIERGADGMLFGAANQQCHGCQGAELRALDPFQRTQGQPGLLFLEGTSPRRGGGPMQVPQPPAAELSGSRPATIQPAPR